MIPVGCLPLVITLLGFGNNQCIASINHLATAFNQKLIVTSEFLNNTLPGLRLLVLDFYTPYFDIITRPAIYGFSESRRACCGTGLYEASIICNLNSNSLGICSNASKYVFWDASHPSQDASKIMAINLFEQGKSLIP
ncbi:hypothetical protein PIB30_028047 [Stylosanthes scabra]|uniref:GDSL esterase/lipase n=1 Tax=Stylosanthes scabra TaxID=79078 RepID=A0ABU6QB02_9FABA|nr:hypothetical protein [Stylosanthes scabra]